MAEIDGGSLSFKSVMDNDQMNTAIDETLRRVQGLSDGTVAGGKAMDNAFDTTADNIRKALGDIGTACQMHEKELQKLEAEYQSLGTKAGDAFTAGRDKEYQQIQQQQQAIGGEITVRKKLLQELREQSDALENAASKQEEVTQKTERAANAHVSFRTRLREVREALIDMEAAGLRGTAEYKRMQDEAARLTDAMADAQAQANILAHDQRGMQGVISGLTGLAGGFSATTGVVSLFAGENEDLQKVMVKVQSLMAITIGLQQVQQALNKDSAFQLVTINGLKEWWATCVQKATIAETANTASTTANTAAQAANATATGAATTSQVASTVAVGAQATAAKAGTVANLGLAGAFRLVGVAIKSIPVFGWILAGISGLIGLYQLFSSKARQAKKDQEEFSKSLIDGCYKPIASIEALSVKYNQLGDDIQAKEKFIKDNKKSFEELGVAVNGVIDAENLLINNKDAFIDAQVAKAKAAVYMQQTMEKVKKQMELENEISKMSDTKTVYASYGMYGGGYSYETENTAKKKKQKELADLKAEIRLGYQNAADEELNGLNLLKDSGIDGVNTYKDGTIGAIEQAITTKQAALKLLDNKDEYKKGLDEIEKLQKQLEGITGKKTTSGSSSSTKDPFLEKLDKQKKEYSRFLKWVNSGDEVLTKAANKEFEGLLKEGATYIDYLKNQRDVILSVDIANRTKAQNAQLRMLNDQISEETKKTVLEAFNNELSEQLTNARTTLEMLNIIEQRRKDLANDGTDIDNNKKDSLDDAEKDVLKQQQQETDALLQEYASYLDKKLKLEQDFTDDLNLLEKARMQATTDTERESIDAAIKNRTDQYNKDTKGSGNAEYDQMLIDYANFEQKKQSIIDGYDEKRKIAQEQGNAQLIEKLNEAQAKALSSLAMDEMQANPDWEKMFGNLDEISTKKLQELLDLFDGSTAYLGVDFDPQDLETIKSKIESIKNEIQDRNPFKALGNSIKDYSKAVGDEAKKKALTNMFSSASSAIDLVSGSLDAAVGGMEKMGITMDEETQAIVNGIGGILDGASQLAQGIATGNPLSIIQGSIGLLTSAFDLFNSKDRKAEKQIKKHAEAIKVLETAYRQLEWAISKALGGDVYKNQQAAINNMKEQQQRLKAMWEAEESKKKTDSGKVDDYKEQYAELGRQIEDMLDDITNDILQTDAKSFADELGDALVDAFSKGEDAAKAFDDVVSNVMKNAVLNQLKKNFLEQQLQGALDGLEKSMGYWNGDEFIFDGLTDAEIQNFKDKVQTIANNFNQALGIYSDLFKDIMEPDSDTSLTGAVKGVSEETSSIVAGQLNAMRINQLEATAIMRQQLMMLSQIANNTSYNYHLAKLDRIVSLLENNVNDSLRSQGLS